MLEGLLSLFQTRSPLLLLRDLLDIAVVSYAVYRLLLLLRGTRAMQVGLGLALIVLVYVIAQRAGLATAYALLDRFLASFLLLVVVIFQADIRRALMRVGNRPFLLRWRKEEETTAVEEVISACVLLAQRRIGALIVFEREASLEDFISQGTVLDAEVSRELLYSIFLPGYENPLHDGAVIIKNARIWKAGAFLPLTTNPTLDRTLGTRHRAALGISEETDAVVVIVSEERGQISLCFSGNIVPGLDANSLRQALYGLFYTKRKQAALLKSAQVRERERETREEGRPSLLGVFPRTVASSGERRVPEGSRSSRSAESTSPPRSDRRADQTLRERPLRPGGDRRSVAPPRPPRETPSKSNEEGTEGLRHHRPPSEHQDPSTRSGQEGTEDHSSHVDNPKEV